MHPGRLIFRVHAIKRMFQRGINEEDVRNVLAQGEVIEVYPDDTPFPSRLVLGRIDARPVHVVVASPADTEDTIVITVYEPALDQWEPGFRRRKG